jgi:hypothetical protein
LKQFLSNVSLVECTIGKPVGFLKEDKINPQAKAYNIFMLRKIINVKFRIKVRICKDNKVILNGSANVGKYLKPNNNLLIIK